MDNEVNFTPEKKDGFTAQVIVPTEMEIMRGALIVTAPKKGEAYIIVHPDDYENVIKNIK